MSDNNTVLGRMDALELLLAELLAALAANPDHPLTDQLLKTKLRKLAIERGNEMREDGMAEDRITALVAVLHRIAAHAGELIEARRIAA